MSDRVEGNDQVVDLLTRWLEFAQQGTLRFAAVIVCRSGEDVATDYAGAQGTEFAAYFGADELKANLARNLRGRSAAAVVPVHEYPANEWRYSIAHWTVAYDFFQWLLNAEMIRRIEGVSDPLRVHFYPGEDGNWDNAFNTPARKQMFYNVARPLVRLMGGEEITERRGRVMDYQHAFSYAPVIKAYSDGVTLPRLQVPQASKDAVRERLGNRSPVVITLRELEIHSYRNSNLFAWLRFSEWLKGRGEDVIFLRDTDKADEQLPGEETFPEASKDTCTRAALYEASKMCFFGSNGPSCLTLLSDVPWACVYPLDESQNYKYNHPRHWEHAMGIKPGESFPWCRHDQRFVLEPDTFDTLKDVWRETWQ